MPYYFSGSYSQPLKIRLNVDQLFSMYHEEKIIKQRADEYKQYLPQNVYEALYNYQVEITD